MNLFKPGDEFILRNTAPNLGEGPELREEITTLSQNFAKIYSEAYIAEEMGLHQIAGVGYRKSLEFLIKDFCIYKNNEKETEIKNGFLGNCIEEFVDDRNIKESAKRATWLANHTTQWEDKNIKQLEILIQLTMTWIRSNILTEKYARRRLLVSTAFIPGALYNVH